MKWLFILLLLFNVIYFGWEFDRQIKIDVSNLSSSIPIPATSHRLLLLTETEPPPHLRQPGSTTDVQEKTAIPPDQGLQGVGAGEPGTEHPGGGDVLVTELPDIHVPDLPATSEKQSCFTFGPLAGEMQVLGLGDWFKSRRAATHIRHTDEQGRRLFWIYLTPQESRSSAMQTIRNLKKKGITDYRLISRGNLLNAISLGLYSSQAAVNERLQELQKKGYKPVVVPYYNGKRVYWLDVRFQGDPNLLNNVFKGYPSRYNYVPVNCSKIAMAKPNP
ncbi:MAG: SPOR domain-containing protein [Gammaproteobacteria bacterium]